MKKRIISLCLVVCLVAVAIVGGTVAYFTDTDSKSNVYTTGKVDIEIIEKHVVNNTVVELIEDDMETLQPGVSYGYNKMIYTVNKEDAAYIRNYVAVECRVPATEAEEYEGMYIGYNNETKTYPNSEKVRHGVKAPTKIKRVEFGEERYFDIWVFETLNDAAVQNGDEVMSMVTFYLTDKYSTEDAEYFESLEIYTVSEAIQAAGLTYAAAMNEMGGATADTDAFRAHIMELFEDIVPKDNQ